MGTLLERWSMVVIGLLVTAAAGFAAVFAASAGSTGGVVLTLLAVGTCAVLTLKEALFIWADSRVVEPDEHEQGGIG